MPRRHGFKVCERCSASFPTRATINGKRRDLSIRRYCLDCSPFAARSRVRYDKRPLDGLRPCARCQERFPVAEFERPSQRTGKQIIRETLCKKCRALDSMEKRRQFKRTCVEIMGGQCVACGYSRCVDALSFHHRDPAEKDFEISRKRTRKGITKEIKAELRRCDLLCLNCHAEVHARVHGSLT
jgi:Zn ribbon nucleic-acid-binding protein